jgi:hypothetical protein
VRLFGSDSNFSPDRVAGKPALRQDEIPRLLTRVVLQETKRTSPQAAIAHAAAAREGPSNRRNKCCSCCSRTCKDGLIVAASPIAIVPVDHPTKAHEANRNDRQIMLASRMEFFLGDLSGKLFVGPRMETVLVAIANCGFDREGEGIHFVTPVVLEPFARTVAANAATVSTVSATAMIFLPRAPSAPHAVAYVTVHEVI